MSDKRRTYWFVAGLLAVAGAIAAFARADPSPSPSPPSTEPTAPSSRPITHRQAAEVDEAIAAYRSPDATITGTVRFVGSSTVGTLLMRAATDFKRMHPAFRIDMTAGGSGSAPPALLAGHTRLAAMSRAMTAEEAKAFAAKFGYPPVEVRVAMDALAIFVHKDNPIGRGADGREDSGLTLAQVDALFSRTRRRGAAAIDRWGELGLDGEWAARSVSLYGLREDRGETGVFREIVLDGGALRLTVEPQYTQSAVVQAVAADPAGIGYASNAFQTRRSRAVPLASADGKPFYAPTPQNVRTGRYPLTRPLLVYINRKPGTRIDAASAEFLRFVLSREGQQMAAEDGYVPLDAAAVEQSLRLLRG